MLSKSQAECIFYEDTPAFLLLWTESCRTKEVLFSDLEMIRTPTLIIHGIHDMVVPFELGEIQHRLIRNSILVPFQFSGHGTFYDEKERFNDVLVKFIES